MPRLAVVLVVAPPPAMAHTFGLPPFCLAAHVR
jgi:hypothetical protein